MASGEGDGLAKGRDQETTLSVLRTEDVPLQEVSGVCLRREAGGDMAMVAFGDRTSIAAWVELPSDDAGAYVWKTVDLADVKGSLIPRDDPQVEAVCADGAGRILILQESPPRVELLDWAARTVATRIALEIPEGHPLHDSWVDAESSQGEGAAFMQNGHLLIAKEKDPAAFIEFGPAGDEPSGFGPDSALAGRRRLADRGGRPRLRPARGLERRRSSSAGRLRGLQRPRGRPGPPPLPAERQVPVDRPGRRARRRRSGGPRRRGLGAARRSTASRRAWR